MGDYQFTKNSPTSFPTGRLLAKVDLGLAAYGITLVGTLFIVLSLNPETLETYAAENPEQVDIVNFLALPEYEQFTILGLYLAWYIFELVTAIFLFFGTRFRSLTLLKIWMVVTIINCILGLVAIVPVYVFISNKPLAVVCMMIIYIYKLYAIYLIDMFLKEIVGRRAAAAALL